MSFFAVYLLVSLKQRASGAAVGATYIGFTVNPQRRIRQHNGDLVNGAKKTSRHRPWDMVLVCYGFPSQRDALQFEWAWQHPHVSIAVRDVAATLPKRGLSGIKGKVRLLMEMLHLEKWRHMPLQLQFTSSASLKYLANCPAMPSGMEVGVASLEALPTTCAEDFDLDENGSISTGPFDNSDCMPAALAAEAVQDSATSPLPETCRGLQPQCVPPKRRGRPPKVQGPAAPDAFANASGSSPAKAARPRGRPRKATAAAAAAADTVGSPSRVAAQSKAVRDKSAGLTGANSQKTASPDKRNSRQRSSVSPAGKRRSSAAAAVAAAAAALPGGSPKRSRGRPRKSPAAAAANPFVDSPIVLSGGSDAEDGSPSPAGRDADSGGAADSLSSASFIDLLSDAESDATTGAAALSRPRCGASPAACDAQGHGLFHDGVDAGAQQASEPCGAAPMCTPQPARKGPSAAAPSSPHSMALEAGPALTPQSTQQLEAALSPMLCSPPMASPPAWDSSPPSSPPVSGLRQQVSPAPSQGDAAMQVPVICLLTPE